MMTTTPTATTTRTLTLADMSAFSSGNRCARLRAYLRFLGIDKFVVHAHARLPADLLDATVPGPRPQPVTICQGYHVFTVHAISCTPAACDTGLAQSGLDDPANWQSLLLALAAPTRHPWVSRFRRQPSLFEVVWRPAEPVVRVAGRWYPKIRPGVSLGLQGSAITLDVPDPPDDGTASMEIPLHYAEAVLGGPLPVECHNRMIMEAMDMDPAAVRYCVQLPSP